MNARIWTHLNDGFVKLTLEVNRPLVWGKFGRHDEGWSSEVHRWEWDGNELVESICTDGRDCDGRLSTHALYRTTPNRFEAVTPTETVGAYYEFDNATGRSVTVRAGKERHHLCIAGGEAEIIRTPAWEKVEAGQRDYSAEAMNY